MDNQAVLFNSWNTAMPDVVCQEGQPGATANFVEYQQLGEQLVYIGDGNVGRELDQGTNGLRTTGLTWRRLQHGAE